MNRQFFGSLPLCLIMLLAACGKKEETTKPTFGAITAAVYASGKVKARDQIQVFPLVSGKIHKVMVNAGDTISPGQVLFEIDNAQSKLAQENARLALELMKEKAGRKSDQLQELELNLALAKEKLQLDSSLFQKQKRLWEQNIGTKNDLDQRKMAFENAQGAVSAAQKRLNLTRTQLQNDLERAQIAYNQSSLAREDFLVKSEFKARVFDVLKKQGELVNPQIPLAILGSAGDFLLELQVNENDIEKIKPGQEVEMMLETYPNQVFQGKVDRIIPIMNEKTRNFKIEALFTQKPPSLYPNTNLEANIVISRKEKALTLPRRFLADNQFVYVSSNEKRKVVLGLKDFQKVEIVSGIDSATLIFLPPK